MDAVLLARLQFALTISFHYIFPPLTIGLGWMIFMYQSLFMKSGEAIYQQLSRFWTKMFAITFIVGVATGITMEFQFGTNWAAYSRFVGDIFGAPLAAEGVLAFFLESSFLGILLYGEKRVSQKLYWISSFLVALGATLSAFWIVVANSWQQTPAGYDVVTEMVNGVEVTKAVLTDFWAAVLNPSMLPRYLHVVGGALVVGTFFVLGVSAWMVLKKKHGEFAKASLKSAVWPCVFSILVTMAIGHPHAVQVAETQPAKLASFEGHWDTCDHAGFVVFGVPNEEEECTDFCIKIPNMLSVLVGNSTDTVVRGLKDIPKEDRPPLMPTFYSFHFMLYLAGLFVLIAFGGLFLMLIKKLDTFKPYLWGAALTVPFPFICNELGWMAAEIGRQPWAVYPTYDENMNILKAGLRTQHAVSASVSAGEILASIIMFSLIYALLFGLWIFLLKRQFNKGPEAIAEETK